MDSGSLRKGVWNLDEKQKEQLQREGFCVVQGCVDQSLIEAFSEECEVCSPSSPTRLPRFVSNIILRCCVATGRDTFLVYFCAWYFFLTLPLSASLSSTQFQSQAKADADVLQWCRSYPPLLTWMKQTASSICGQTTRD